MYGMNNIKEGNKFHVLPLASTWGSTVYLNVLFLIYACKEASVRHLHVAYDALISDTNYPASSITKYNF
jgi:hypothetical protein